VTSYILENPCKNLKRTLNEAKRTSTEIVPRGLKKVYFKLSYCDMLRGTLIAKLYRKPLPYILIKNNEHVTHQPRIWAWWRGKYYIWCWDTEKWKAWKP